MDPRCCLQEQLKVMPVGTVKNVADLGTKPPSKNRVNLILNWCSVYNDMERRSAKMSVREMRMKWSANQKSTSWPILLLEGLGQVAGEVIDSEAQCAMTPMTTASSTTSRAMWVIVIFLVMTIGGLALASSKMWQKIKKILKDLEEMKEAQRVDGMMIDAFEHERKEETEA